QYGMERLIHGERKFGREMSDSGINSNLTNIVYDVNLTAGPTVNMKVVLDDLTGDEIKGRGAGSLKIRSGTSEPLKMYGRYDIDEGNYTFTFQSFFKKPFELKKGAENYIEWSGDPYDAKINLTATYTANNVSYAPLAGSLKNIAQGVSKARGDVYVVAKLTDKLFEPKIDFSLDFPPSSVVNSDPTLAFSLQQLQKNMNEMNKQATYLVVFGIFAPVESDGNTVAQLQEIATNSLSGIFFNVVNEQVKKVVSSIFKTEKLNFNFNSSVYNRNVIDENSKFGLGSNVNASIGSSLFKNKVIISIGGSVEGLVQSGTIQQDVTGLWNASIEVLLNPSGTFRANLFFRQNTDYLTNSSSGAGRMNRGGIGLSYRKDANSIGELFFLKKNKTPVPVPPPEEKTEAPKEEPKKQE
ncbi:MAG: translocation/assembly module TamB domain-containing protein, partial [Bacteroidota bacterium]